MHNNNNNNNNNNNKNGTITPYLDISIKLKAKILLTNKINNMTKYKWSHL